MPRIRKHPRTTTTTMMRPSNATIHEVNAAQLEALGEGYVYHRDNETDVDGRGRWEVHYKEDPNVEQSPTRVQFLGLMGHVNELKEMETAVMTKQDFEKGRMCLELWKWAWLVMATEEYLTDRTRGEIDGTPEQDEMAQSQWEEASSHVKKHGGHWWYKDTLEAQKK